MYILIILIKFKIKIGGFSFDIAIFGGSFWFSCQQTSGSMSLLELLKDGSKHYSGVEEAVLRNIEACKQLSQILRTSFGPNGK